MSEMIERVARAVAERAGRTWSEEASDAWLYKDLTATELVRVAIAAMREPTEAMARAGAAAIFQKAPDGAKPGDHCAGVVAEGWQVMIDEMLKP